MDDTQQPEPLTSASEAPGPESSAPAPENPAPTPDEPFPPEPILLAPGVPRLGIPVDAARPLAEASPNYLLLTIVSVVTLGIDISTKNWAEKALEAYPGTIPILENHAAFILAKNRGGAWGFFQGANEAIRRPFFLLVSAAAIVFIVTLFRRLQPKQVALRWGLPLVMGGALGNVFDRIRYGFVIDFIDVHTQYKGVDHHWPTFNVADVAICVGVGLMAIDMFTSKRGKKVAEALPPWTDTSAEPLAPAESEAPPAPPASQAPGAADDSSEAKDLAEGR